jgi:hypothetical protein
MNRSDRQITQELDNNKYNDHDLVEVKIPLHLSYVTSWADYQRVDGSMKVDGVFYNYVKRKVSNDTLYLLCLPNEKKTKLYLARNEYSKQSNDIPSNKNERSTAKKINISSEYVQQMTEYSLVFQDMPAAQHTFHFSSRLVNRIAADKYQPPRHLLG